MDETRAIRRAGWGGVAGLVLVVAGFLFWAAATSDPTASDASIRETVLGDDEQTFAQVSYLLLAPGLVLLLWWATALRRLLALRAGSDRLASAVVPGLALWAGLLLVGLSLDVGSTVAASWVDEFRPDVNTVRALGIAGAGIWLGGLLGAAVVVGVTSRVAHETRSVPPWMAWVGYAVAVVCTFGFLTWGIAMPVFGLWLVGALVGVLRAAPSVGAAVSTTTAGVPTQPTPPPATEAKGSATGPEVRS